MKRYIWLIISLTVVAAVVVVQMRQSAQPTEVEVAEAKSAPLVAEWTAVGYVEARTANVTAPQVGRVENVSAREGERVRAGQRLATLASRSEEAAVQVQRAGVKLAGAQANASWEALREAEDSQRDRERRARAETISARERWRQASGMLQRSRKTVPAQVEAARSEVEAARATLRDLERGSRPEEIAQAEAEVRSAEAGLTRAKSEIERQKQLFDEGAVTKRDLETAEEALVRADSALRSRREALALLKRGSREDLIAAARARLRTAEAQQRAAEGEMAGLDVDSRKVAEAASAFRAAQAGEAEVRSGRKKLETLKQQAVAADAGVRQSRSSVEQAAAGLSERAVFAPFDGVVGRRYVDPGDMANPSQPLFSIVESSSTWVSAEVDEQDLAPVHEGQAVVVTAPAFVGREFAGKVVRIGGEAVPQTEVRTGARIVRVRVSLDPNPPETRALLKPGMEVHASAKATLAPKAILVPSDALLVDAAGSYVWVVDGGKIGRRRVKAGYVNGPETEIVSGLRAGARVVVGGKEGLKEGQAVRAKAPASGA